MTDFIQMFNYTQGTGNNTTINLDVIGEPNDPMTARRCEVFEPVGMRIANQMESIVGRGSEKLVPTPQPIQEKTLVKKPDHAVREA